MTEYHTSSCSTNTAINIIKHSKNLILFDVMETFSLHLTSNKTRRYFKELHKDNGAPFKRTSAQILLYLGPHLTMENFLTLKCTSNHNNSTSQIFTISLRSLGLCEAEIKVRSSAYTITAAHLLATRVGKNQGNDR